MFKIIYRAHVHLSGEKGKGAVLSIKMTSPLGMKSDNYLSTKKSQRRNKIYYNNNFITNRS
jgi:hypothetical protein